MQELIDSYERSANQYLEMKQINKASLYFRLARWAKEGYLEKEKEQIMEAFYADDNTDKCKYEDSEDYYNQTYNQNK